MHVHAREKFFCRFMEMLKVKSESEFFSPKTRFLSQNRECRARRLSFFALKFIIVIYIFSFEAENDFLLYLFFRKKSTPSVVKEDEKFSPDRMVYFYLLWSPKIHMVQRRLCQTDAFIYRFLPSFYTFYQHILHLLPFYHNRWKPSLQKPEKQNRTNTKKMH